LASSSFSGKKEKWSYKNKNEKIKNKKVNFKRRLKYKKTRALHLFKTLAFFLRKLCGKNLDLLILLLAKKK